ncbi:MAG: hypothetical protein A2Z18_11450 [Armatimonadetes bacterium RBG_16_58_9]|nr:MAG: hypothetical protein A2Z18_11450 [Armatimonadetes bacterium RBG_16_58_9]
MERDMRRLVIVIAVELVFAIFLGGWVATRIFTTRSRIADLDVRIANFEPTVRQIERYQKATAKLVPKMDLLNQAKTGTMRWYNTLDRLAESMPASTWLTRISTGSVKDGEDVVLSLSGLSPTQAKVGETMMRLSLNPDFESVDLHYTRNTDVGLASAIEFEVGAQMNTSRDSKKEAKDGGSQS